jgi:selenocysteine lyase/cysteine desulfurase
MVESIGLIEELTREAIDAHTTALAARTLELGREHGYQAVTAEGRHAAIATLVSKLGRDETAARLAALEHEHGIQVARALDRHDRPHLRFSFHCHNTEDDLTRAFAALERAR